jgi:hypothetical protein
MMMLRFAAAAAVMLAGTAQAAILHDNGPIAVDGLSIVVPPAETLGFTSNSSFRLADNFIVSGPAWTVESISFYAYQTTATAFTFTSATWSIVAGTDVNTGSVVAAGTTAVSNGGFVGYRVTDTTLTSTTRPIYEIVADMPDFSLSAGNYFVTWALAGTLGSGPFVPPVLGSIGSGNGLQAPTTGSFVPALETGTIQTVEFPFTINGSAGAVPEPASWALMIIGFGAVGSSLRARRRSALTA